VEDVVEVAEVVDVRDQIDVVVSELVLVEHTLDAVKLLKLDFHSITKYY
jgi:hypothetical protein